MRNDGPFVTMLFIPGSASDKIRRIPELESDAVILDLEDAVAFTAKAAARESVADAVRRFGADHALYVRVNPVESPHFVDDLAAVVGPGPAGINLPKVDSPADLLIADRLITHYEAKAGVAAGSVKLMATIETVVGVANVVDIARATDRLTTLCFGAGDFSLDIGIDWPDPDGRASAAMDHAKVQLVLACRLAGLQPPHDSVYSRYGDLDGLRAEAGRSKRLGFLGKHAIHPTQLPVIADVYRPSARQVERARGMVDAFGEAEARGEAAVGVAGELVDYPILYRARQILRIAEASSR